MRGCHLWMRHVSLLKTSLLYKPSAAMTIHAMSVYLLRSGSIREEAEADEKCRPHTRDAKIRLARGLSVRHVAK
jgi:hypothetical protein